MNYLSKLYRVLNFSPPNAVEEAFHMPILWRHAVAFILIINVLSTPYVLYLLYLLKKWRWLIYFGVLMVIALVINAGLVFALDFKGSLAYLFIGLFLILFMILLRPKVDEWIELERLEARIMLERRKRAEKKQP
jgi:hypothetical protein